MTHELNERVTELTVRHGRLGNIGFTTAWTDENESIDFWMSGSTEEIFVIDAVYTEYVDDDLMVYGGYLEMSGEFALENELQFNLQIIAADEVLAPELGMGFSVSFEIPSIESEWISSEPLDYLHHLSTPPDEESGEDGECYPVEAGFVAPEDGWFYPDSSDAEIWLEGGNESVVEDGIFCPDSYEGGAGGEYNDVGLIEGEFSTLTGYSAFLSIDGVPAEDFGIDLDAFNVQLSDSIPGQGTFSEDMAVFSGAIWEHECDPVGGVEELDIDPSTNGTVSAQCGLAPPISMGMASMMGISMAMAFDSGVQELFTAMEEQVGAWLEEIAPEEESFICDNGEEIPAEWENDGEIDCQDGSDEDGSNEDVFQKYIEMFEALNNSNLGKTMEAFGEKLGELMEDNDPSDPLANLDDMCPIMFWDTSNSRVLGMALMATDEGDHYEVLLGPDISGVKDHSYDLSIVYLTGNDARNAKLDALGLSELKDLAPESKHDVEELYDILGDDFLPDLDQTDTDEDGVIDYFDQDDDGDGLFDWEDPNPLQANVPDSPDDEEIDTIPGPSVLAVVSMLGAAALLMPRREE